MPDHFDLMLLVALAAVGRAVITRSQAARLEI
jgi:hypothetical protein